MANEGICLDALETFAGDKNSSLARIVNCADTPRQLWSYNFKTQNIIQRYSNNCLTAMPNIETASHSQTIIHRSFIEQLSGSNVKHEESKFNVSTMPCTASALQKWMLLPFEWKWSERMMLTFNWQLGLYFPYGWILHAYDPFSIGFNRKRLVYYICGTHTWNTHPFKLHSMWYLISLHLEKNKSIIKRWIYIYFPSKKST